MQHDDSHFFHILHVSEIDVLEYRSVDAATLRTSSPNFAVDFKSTNRVLSVMIVMSMGLNRRNDPAHRVSRVVEKSLARGVREFGRVYAMIWREKERDRDARTLLHRRTGLQDFLAWGTHLVTRSRAWQGRRTPNY